MSYLNKEGLATVITKIKSHLDKRVWTVAHGGTGGTTVKGALTGLGLDPIMPGDTVTLTWAGAGYFTSSKTDCRFCIPLRGACTASSVTCDSATMTTRQGGSYTHGSSSTTAVAWVPKSCAFVDDTCKAINIILTRTTTTNATNNDAVGVVGTFTFTFS